MITGTAEAVIYLASCAVNGTKPDAERLAGADFGALLSFASYHMLGAVVAMGLEDAGFTGRDIRKHIAFSVRKSVCFEAANREVLAGLEEAGIWYMPLKGAVLKDYYPRFGMREMSDYDILIDTTRAHDVRRIMQSLGFRTEEFGWGTHDVYYREPLCNFEMHRELFEASFDEHLHSCYSSVKSRLIKDDGNNYGYHFTPEDFYLYITAHEYKHYSLGGTGLRSLLDVYVLLRRFEGQLDFGYVLSEAEKLGLSEFEAKNRGLALNLFGNRELTDGEQEMLEYIVQSGVHGNVEISVRNGLKKCGGGKIKYLLSRIFPSMNSTKHKIYYPALIIFRLLRALTLKRHKILLELRHLFSA
ncbi:MAG: nucleotidyltransferase family protein [Synergistaceae bacterium]|nr:nucleotidyltransferase family protein [Synergistaceae bacterium]